MSHAQQDHGEIENSTNPRPSSHYQSIAPAFIPVPASLHLPLAAILGALAAIGTTLASLLAHETAAQRRKTVGTDVSHIHRFLLRSFETNCCASRTAANAPFGLRDSLLAVRRAPLREDVYCRLTKRPNTLYPSSRAQ